MVVSSVYQNRLEIYPSMAPNNCEWVHNANIHGGLWFPLTKCHCIIIFKVFAHYFAQIWQGAGISINPAIKSNYESGRKWWWLMGRGGKWDRSRAVNRTSRNFTVPGEGPYSADQRWLNFTAKIITNRRFDWLLMILNLKLPNLQVWALTRRRP